MTLNLQLNEWNQRGESGCGRHSSQTKRCDKDAALNFFEIYNLLIMKWILVLFMIMNLVLTRKEPSKTLQIGIKKQVPAELCTLKTKKGGIQIHLIISHSRYSVHALYWKTLFK